MALVIAAVVLVGCRQPSPAVPTEVEIDWPDAALPGPTDAGPTDANARGPVEQE